ncbi:MAG TPA: GNAT family N-acetyltransferase [Gaiellaceae bacterium]|nr:GNAT family N-acetyltransferase [Gaiellaceae bacterium]
MKLRAPTQNDVPETLAVLRAFDAEAWGDSDWNEQDLREHWDELDLERDAWIAELDGRIAGYADVTVRGPRVIADGYVAPDLRGRGVGSALVEAVERRALEEPGRVYVHYATLGEWSAPFFEARGYRPVRHQWRMVIDLEEEPEAPAPEGIEIRPYRAGEERAIHEALEEAWSVGGWEYQPRTFEEYAKGTFERPGHDPTLCLVAVVDGTLAGASLNDWKRNGDWGWIGTLGVRPAFRRRGIAEALLKRSFAEFFRRGERRVALGVDAQSPTGATRLYERAGMHVLYEVIVYEKELRAG